MDIKEIKYWASCFRQGIEIAKRERLFRRRPFSDFPNACCTDAPDLLAEYLIEHDSAHSISCQYVYGVYRYDEFENIYGHAWLQIDKSIIVDITADQRQFNCEIFPKNAFVPCFVERQSAFHSLFEIEPLGCREFYGLKLLGEDSYNRLKPIYDIITQCINE